MNFHLLQISPSIIKISINFLKLIHSHTIRIIQIREMILHSIIFG
jgi:hypothetical protein